MSEFDDAINRWALPEFVAAAVADRRKSIGHGGVGDWRDGLAVVAGAGLLALVVCVGVWSILR